MYLRRCGADMLGLLEHDTAHDGYASILILVTKIKCSNATCVRVAAYAVVVFGMHPRLVHNQPTIRSQRRRDTCSFRNAGGGPVRRRLQGAESDVVLMQTQSRSRPSTACDAHCAIPV